MYKKEELSLRYHLKRNRCVMDNVMLADLPYAILITDWKDRFLKSLPARIYGYDNKKKEMEAFFITHDPDFKRGKDTRYSEYSSMQSDVQVIRYKNIIASILLSQDI